MIIGLTGYKGSGKSTVAKYLAEQYGFKRVNFKDGLVAEMKERLPDVLTELREHYGYLGNEELFTFKPSIMRALMQNYGTEVRRKDDENYWVEQYLASIPERGSVVSDDVRFHNEYQAVKENGGIIIRVVREDITHGGEHASEKEQESFEADFTIVGESGNHEKIYAQVRQIIDTIKAD